jgi:putative transposase
VIGRPWLTVAIDVNTRINAGIHLSLDAPSSTSIALCMANAVVPKEEYLSRLGVNAQWPVWGFPTKVFVDNGSDFRSESFVRSASMKGIHVEYRPAGRAHYGGHIERLIGTTMSNVHHLPGTTFSNVPTRGEYQSEQHAAMTLIELERVIVRWFCNIYHQRVHSELKMPPIKKWEIGIYGEQGIGPPAMPSSPETVLIDFLPIFDRTIQQTGVDIEGARYSADCLARWLHSKEPGTNGKVTRKFVFRRDPRDISRIWFFDPELKQYFRIPFADLMLPPTTAAEFNAAKKKLHDQGHKSVNQSLIHSALAENDTEVANAVKSTAQARRRAQKKRTNAFNMKSSTGGNPTLQQTTASAEGQQPTDFLEDDDDDDYVFKGQIA